MSEADKEKKTRLIRAMSDAEGADGFECYCFIGDETESIETCNLTQTGAIFIIAKLIKEFNLDEEDLAIILYENEQKSL